MERKVNASLAYTACNESTLRFPAHPIHVLTLTSFYPSEGDEVSGCFVAESLRDLSRYGVTSSVVAVDTVYHVRKYSRTDAPAEWLRYPQLPGNLGLSTAGDFLGRLLLRRVRQLHTTSPLDLIHAHAALPCGHAAAFLSHRLGIPFVVTVHGLDVFNSCFQQGIAAQWRRKASMRVYKSARRVICISQKVQQLLLEGMESPASSAVVYNGTDPTVFSPASVREQLLSVLIVGNLLVGKGHELVLRALGRLQDSHPTLQCQIIGDGADQKRFADLVRDLGLTKRVHFLGRRSRAEVAEAMRDCTVFVLPSRYEGLGCVYLEAMACAKPVIACRGQGIDEIIQQGVNGWLIPVDGLDELASALQTLLGNADLRRQIGEAARQTILDGYTLSNQSQSLLKVYREVIR
jgi:glycosyltransferase involved in cell wall biosynthesis